MKKTVFRKIKIGEKIIVTNINNIEFTIIPNNTTLYDNTNVGVIEGDILKEDGSVSSNERLVIRIENDETPPPSKDTILKVLRLSYGYEHLPPDTIADIILEQWE